VLSLRRGRVVSVEAGDRVARFSVSIDDTGAERPAIAYPELTGPLEPGDEVIVNVEALDLGLGSGGFDLLVANLSRGLGLATQEDAHVMKLNYTPIQHAVHPIEDGLERVEQGTPPPAAVLPLHGQLAVAAFAFSERAPGKRLGYVQSEGGALAGWLSDSAADLLGRGLIADHVTVAPCFGGRREAITLEGALHAGAERLGWEAAMVAPGPGILGSASALGHGGLAALHSAHSALALGGEVVLAPRISSGDQRPRHRGLSHHTRAVMSLLLRPVTVAIPDGISDASRRALENAARETGHETEEVGVGDLVEAFLGSGLPATTMGRSFAEDEDFFRAGLAGGAILAGRVGEP
jgi:hypothetical protein